MCVYVALTVTRRDQPHLPTRSDGGRCSTVGSSRMCCHIVARVARVGDWRKAEPRSSSKHSQAHVSINTSLTLRSAELFRAQLRRFGLLLAWSAAGRARVAHPRALPLLLVTIPPPVLIPIVVLPIHQRLCFSVVCRAMNQAAKREGAVDCVREEAVYMTRQARLTCRWHSLILRFLVRAAANFLQQARIRGQAHPNSNDYQGEHKRSRAAFFPISFACLSRYVPATDVAIPARCGANIRRTIDILRLQSLGRVPNRMAFSIASKWPSSRVECGQPSIATVRSISARRTVFALVALPVF